MTMPSSPYVVDPEALPLEGWDGVSWKTLFSGDRTPTGQITQGVTDISPAPAEGLKLHRHAQSETYYVLSGTGKVRVEDEEFPLAPGMAAFIPGGALHAAYATGSEPLRILYTFPTDSFEEVIYDFPDGDPRG